MALGAVVILVCALGVAGMAAGRQRSSFGDAATWDLAPAQRVTASATTLHVLVTRLDCHSGVTGEVLQPVVRQTKRAVVITFNVAHDDEGGFVSCIGNDQVPYTVHLKEPLEDRSLIDGVCLQGGAGVGTAPCADGTGKDSIPPSALPGHANHDGKPLGS